MIALLAEDDEALRGFVTLVLEGLAYRVIQASNGLEAFEKLCKMADDGQAMPHIIVSDNNMPRLSGLDLLNRLREDERFSRISFILMSGRFQTPDGTSLQEVCERFGARFLQKPFEYDDLIRFIEG